MEKTILTKEEWQEIQAMQEKAKTEREDKKKVIKKITMKKNIKRTLLLGIVAVPVIAGYILISTQPLYWCCILPTCLVIALIIESK